MNLLYIAAVLGGSVALIVVVIRVLSRPRLHSNAATERLGPVSEQWLTAHRGNR